MKTLVLFRPLTAELWPRVQYVTMEGIAVEQDGESWKCRCSWAPAPQATAFLDVNGQKVLFTWCDACLAWSVGALPC